MASKPRNNMPREERAKQFMPFAALKGLDEALAAKEKIIVPKKELSEEMLSELDEKMKQIEKGSLITVVYYDKEEYIKMTGIVSRIDPSAKVLQVVNRRIDFEDILAINFGKE
ncbi:MAG: YolD-like family protein [Agathobacter sp.]|uniref:YolD-like family protein n=1 Tax=Agathobacter sp. TaxID=2021311 RepID=UPI00258B8E86|nr:YolD-like family protein [Agathobacter sp.]MCR5677141.1 YolD-like family protein [Agathobacter sp.]